MPAGQRDPNLNIKFQCSSITKLKAGCPKPVGHFLQKDTDSSDDEAAAAEDFQIVQKVQKKKVQKKKKIQKKKKKSKRN